MGTWREAIWRPGPHAIGGRRGRESFTYQAFVPDPLAGKDLTFTAATAADLAEAEAAVAVAEHSEHLLGMETLARLLLRGESVASSRIEGLVCSQRRLAEAAFAPEHASHTARQVLANIEALREAVTTAASVSTMTVDVFCGIHAILVRDDRELRDHAGCLRTVQNWIGGRGDSPRGAAFVPPPPELVEPLMADLAAFCDRTDLPTLAQAAIAHGQFETIHPFVDGNGRVGRCLISAVLSRRGLARRVVVPVSLVLAAYGDHYVQGLVDFREGRIDQWCALFASAVTLAVRGTRRLADQLETMVTRWRAETEARPDSHLWRACADTVSAPVFTLATLQRDLGCSQSAASEVCHRLSDLGIVVQVSLGKRNRVYLNRAVLRLLDDAERDLLTDENGDSGRLLTSARASTVVPPPTLPPAEHALLETYPLGSAPPPTTAALAALAAYPTDQVRPALERLVELGAISRTADHRWELTGQGRRLRAALLAGNDLL